MLIVIIAVTKAYGGFCVAGIDKSGKLVRPICGRGDNRFWPRGQLTHAGGFIKCGDVWELEGRQVASEFPNHNEDFLVSRFRYKHSLGNERFLSIISCFAEGEDVFLDTVNANSRSLCLVSAKRISPINRYWEGKWKPKMRLTGYFSLDNPKTQDNLYPVKDCKWVGLMDQDYRPPIFRQVFVSIGLATPAPHDNVEYPQIIGVHTMPYVDFTDSYPD